MVVVFVGLASLPAALAVGPPNPTSPTRTAVPETSGVPSGGLPRGIATTVEVAPAYAPGVGTSVVGPLSPATPMEAVVGLSVSQPAALNATLAAMYVPGTPLYHQYLTPAEVETRFGPAAATVAAATSYFAGHGITVSDPMGGLLLGLRGPSTAFAAAFGTSFEIYRLPSGATVIDHPTPARLPSDLPWTGALGLSSLSAITPAYGNPTTPVPIVRPAAGCGSGPSGALSPCEVQGAYGETPLLAGGTNGTGVRIGIVDAYSGQETQAQLGSDLAAFDAAFGLPVPTVHYLYPVATSLDLNNSSVNPDWALEESLDLQWAHVAAPGASLEMTFSPDAGPGLYAAIASLVGGHLVDVISLSWGEPDTGIFNPITSPCSFVCNATTDGSYDILGPVLEFAAAEGISVFAASGDCGSADGTAGITTNFPASDPYVTGVGGTVLTATTSGGYFSEVAWSGNVTGGALPGCKNQGGSGGGYSPLPRPWWQTGLSTPPSGRGVPDVSIDAGTPVAIYYHGSATPVIGTSVGTPLWAGLAALADQHAGTPLGLLSPALYRIAAGPSYASAFHDITSGNNGAYIAGPGWDPVTGLGSPNATVLVGDLTPFAAPTSSEPRVFLYGSPRFGEAPLTVTFSLSATGGTGAYPTRGVSFGDGNASTFVATTTHVYPTPGVYSASAWVVDSSGNTSASPPIVIVVGGGVALSVGLTSSNTSVTVGTAVTFHASVTGANGSVRYSYTFGDGTYLDNTTASAITHTYGAAGGFCAEVIASDSGVPPDGGASPRVAEQVGNAPSPNCQNDATPLTAVPTTSGAVRDAPADFPSLFAISGGATSAGGLADSVEYFTNSTNASYVAVCGCAIFHTPGSYTVRAIVSDPVNQVAYATTNVTIAPALVGAFAASITYGPAPLSVTFFAAAQGGYGVDANRAQWNFGNGATAVGHTVSAIYPIPGEYVAVGQLSDRGHGNTSEAFVIDVLPTPTAEGPGLVATISPAVNIASGTTVRFTAQALGSFAGEDLGTEWSWGYGHSAFGALANQTFYAPASGGAGNLTATLFAVLPNAVVVDALNLSIGPQFAVEARGFVPAISLLTMSSVLSPTYGQTPLAVTGVVHASGPGSPSVTWVWQDGTYSTQFRITHTFYAAGDYTVQAIVRDGYGDSVTDSYRLVANGPLVIYGGPSPAGGVPPITVRFTALGVGGTGAPYTYRWSFGGAPPVSGEEQYRNYSVYGVYSARVTVTDSVGEEANRTWTVDVHPLIVLTAGQILEISVGLGGLLAAVVLEVRFRRARPPRPSLSQRRAAEDVRRVV